MCLGIPGQVVEITDPENQIAKVEVSGVRRNVNVGLLGGPDGDSAGVEPGEWVLIHVGFAISRVDEDEARRTREMLESLGELYEQEIGELRGSEIE